MGLCQWLLLHQLLLERSCADGTPLSTRLRAWDQHLLIHGGEVGCVEIHDLLTEGSTAAQPTASHFQRFLADLLIHCVMTKGVS